MHLMVSHFEGGVKRARVGAAHVCAPNMSFTRVWHLAWAFGKPKRQNRVSVHAAAKPSVGHTLAPSLATVPNAELKCTLHNIHKSGTKLKH